MGFSNHIGFGMLFIFLGNIQLTIPGISSLGIPFMNLPKPRPTQSMAIVPALIILVMSSFILCMTAPGPPPINRTYIRSPTYSPMISPMIGPRIGIGRKAPRIPPTRVPPTLNNACAAGSPDNNDVTPTIKGPTTGIFLRAFLTIGPLPRYLMTALLPDLITPPLNNLLPLTPPANVPFSGADVSLPALI